MKKHNFEFYQLEKMVIEGRKVIARLKIGSERGGDSHASRGDHHAFMENLILRVRRLDSSTFKSHGGKSKSKLISAFNRDKRAAEDILWDLYSIIQLYAKAGKFSDGAERHSFNVGQGVVDHIIKTHSESASCGSYWRSKAAHKQPVTSGPLGRVKGLECDTGHEESRRAHVLCSRADRVTGGRSVLAIGTGKSFPIGQKFDTHKVRLLGNNAWLMAGGGDHPLSRLSKSTDPNYLASLKVGMHVKVIQAPKVADKGFEHTVRKAIY